MAASPGTYLGPYEVLAPLGAGGMGEVYSARDSRLGREVAIKILPELYSENTERLSRFEQEARAAGALNHPNILAIYDIGRENGSPYIVSELLEGETLREKLHGSPLPQRKAIDYALQIARGLAAAHEKGIIHRDLKPENLFITRDGHVKILDFGLAKLVETSPDQPQSAIPTRRVDTGPGVLLGTVGYMSPEQVRGLGVDHRSDIFSFGAILYEMLSGNRAFHGESAADTMSAILKQDPPDLAQTNKHVSPAIERFVDHCLAKSLGERFQSARDLAFALESLSGSTTSLSQAAVAGDFVPPRTGIPVWIPWTIAAVLLATAAGLAYLYYWQRSADSTPATVTRFRIDPPERTDFLNPPVVSPDGRRVVLNIRDSSGKNMLWVRPLGSLDSHPLAGTESGGQAFWSPDGQSIGFFALGKLKRIDVNGGPAQSLCDVAGATNGAAWGPDGTIIFSRNPAQGLFRISAAGGTPEPLTTLDKARDETSHRWPFFLPNGRHFLYVGRSTQPEKAGIFVGSIDSQETKFLIQADSSMAYASGYILFVKERTLVAQAFDPDTLELSGPAIPMIDQVGLNTANSRAQFSVSQTGVLAYRTNLIGATAQLTWFDRNGRQLGTIGEPAAYSGVRISPDEKRVAVVRLDVEKGGNDIWLIELTRPASSKFTFDPANEGFATWSPDGNRIVFSSTREGVFNLHHKLSSGVGKDDVLLKSDEVKLANDWSADGRYILFQNLSSKTLMDLWVLPLFDDQQPRPFLQTEFAEFFGRFSPDGQLIAYASNESGKNEVYVQNFPAAGGKWQISNGGGTEPHWRGDGKELFYVTPDTKLMAVEVDTGTAGLQVGTPKELFAINVSNTGSRYDVTNDGQRFLIITLGQQPTGLSNVAVVMNWPAELKR